MQNEATLPREPQRKSLLSTKPKEISRSCFTPDSHKHSQGAHQSRCCCPKQLSFWALLSHQHSLCQPILLHRRLCRPSTSIITFHAGRRLFRPVGVLARLLPRPSLMETMTAGLLSPRRSPLRRTSSRRLQSTVPVHKPLRIVQTTLLLQIEWPMLLVGNGADSPRSQMMKQR
jgi:hypothetical protein